MSTTQIEETFSDGKPSGRGAIDENGAKSGAWEFYYRSGSIKGTGKFVDGQMDDAWTWTREDGTLMRTGHFLAGEQRGEWTTYDRGGNLVRTTDYQ